jgi:transposase-like protein
MGSEKPASRRRYSREFKLQVLAECDGPGASVAKVAMAHGINANIVHRWRLVDRRAQSPTPMVSNQVRSGPDDRCAGTAKSRRTSRSSCTAAPRR